MRPRAADDGIDSLNKDRRVRAAERATHRTDSDTTHRRRALRKHGCQAQIDHVNASLDRGTRVAAIFTVDDMEPAP
jgi:hypothetical protein